MVLSLVIAACLGQTDAPALRVAESAGRVQVVARLPGALAKSLPQGKCAQDDGEAVLRFCRVFAGKVGPPLLGAYERKDHDLVFRPRLMLDPGAAYRATLILGDNTTLVRDYQAPARLDGVPGHVVKVYPTGDVLPANHLKFYIYFSRPMRGGQDFFKQIKLVDADGKEIRDPWLVDELWDEENNCLILYIHPGRIKWGVLLRELLGPVLFPDRPYRLVIPGELLDDRGQKLGKEFVKKFRTIAEDRAQVNTAAWTLKGPKAGTTDALTVNLGKSIDHRALQHLIKVSDPKGQFVEGKIEIGPEEKTWKFTPRRPWSVAEYQVRIDPGLEDTNGNRPTRPFDLDLKSPPPVSPRLTLPFHVK